MFSPGKLTFIKVDRPGFAMIRRILCKGLIFFPPSSPDCKMYWVGITWHHLAAFVCLVASTRYLLCGHSLEREVDDRLLHNNIVSKIALPEDNRSHSLLGHHFISRTAKQRYQRDFRLCYRSFTLLERPTKYMLTFNSVAI